jgi:DNA-binding NtrC family response regulator
LNDGTIRRLGSSVETPHTARVVAASNAALSHAASNAALSHAASNAALARRAAEGSFRSDLLMRLNPSLALELPPLSQRREDLPELARLTASAFWDNPRHRRAIASLVRAAGGPDPEPADAFTLAVSDREARDSASAVVFVLPGKAWAAMQRHSWPGNLRQFEMILADSLAAAVYAGPGASLDRSGRVRIPLDPRLLFDLLAGARASEPAPSGAGFGGFAGSAERPRASSVAGFRRELERSALRALFREAGGDFARMAERMTGSASAKEARAVRLRFNKLGLSARDEK